MAAVLQECWAAAYQGDLAALQDGAARLGNSAQSNNFVLLYQEPNPANGNLDYGKRNTVQAAVHGKNEDAVLYLLDLATVDHRSLISFNSENQSLLLLVIEEGMQLALKKLCSLYSASVLRKLLAVADIRGKTPQQYCTDASTTQAVENMVAEMTADLLGPTFLHLKNLDSPTKTGNARTLWQNGKKFSEGELFEAADMYHGRQGRITPATVSFLAKAIPWMTNDDMIKDAVYRVVAHSYRDAMNPKNAQMVEDMMASFRAAAAFGLQQLPAKLYTTAKSLGVSGLAPQMYSSVKLDVPIDDDKYFPEENGAADDGVRFQTKSQKFHVYMTVAGEQQEVASFKDEDEANAAYANAQAEAQAAYETALMDGASRMMSQAHATPVLFSPDFLLQVERLSRGKKFTPTELQCTILLILSTYVDSQLENYTSQFKTKSPLVHPAVLSFADALSLVESRYAGQTSMLMALSRITFTSSDPAEHLAILDQMCEGSPNQVKGSFTSGKRSSMSAARGGAGFKAMRLKTALDKSSAFVKDTSVVIKVEFDNTFDHHVPRQEFVAAAESVRTANKLSRVLIMAALDALRSDLIKNEVVAHMIELKLYFPEFEAQKEIYDAWRLIVDAGTFTSLSKAWFVHASAEHLTYKGKTAADAVVTSRVSHPTGRGSVAPAGTAANFDLLKSTMEGVRGR